MVKQCILVPDSHKVRSIQRVLKVASKSVTLTFGQVISAMPVSSLSKDGRNFHSIRPKIGLMWWMPGMIESPSLSSFSQCYVDHQPYKAYYRNQYRSKLIGTFYQMLSINLILSNTLVRYILSSAFLWRIQFLNAIVR